MRDFELDDRFWRDALAALAGGSRASALSSSYPEFSACLAELEAEASRDALLIGVRLESAGQNPRLLSLLVAAFLARAGVSTLIVDLSPDVRWLERLFGEDLKEGIVDHIQYGVPLERCVRETGLVGLSILTGGAHFLTGSPLDGGPAFRGSLDRLRQRHQALIVTLPGQPEALESTGVVALCDVLFAVEEGEARARLAGCERAVVRLTGSPHAAEDLARLVHRFLGSLPAFLGRRAEAASTAGPADAGMEWGVPDPDDEADDLAFLTAFEEGPSGVLPGPVETADRSGSRRRRGSGGGLRFALAGLALLALTFAAVRYGPSVRGWLEADGDLLERSLAELGLARDPIPLSVEPQGMESGTVVPLVPGVGDEGGEVGDEGGVTAEAGVDPDPVATPPSVPGRPAPYSLHVGSYQRETAARSVVDRLAAAGYTAFLAPISLPATGRWQRVYVGSFADSTAAHGTLAKILEQGLVAEGAVRSTPWTFELETTGSREAAAERIRVLRGQGISAYAAGVSPIRIYAGAYASREEAELLARALDSSVRAARLTLREL